MFRECPNLRLIEAVEAEGFGGGGVVTAAFGDVQVAGILYGRHDDGQEVGYDPPGGGVLAECRVSYMVMCLDGPELVDQAGQVRRGVVRAGQAGDGVDGLAGGLAGGGVLPPAGDLDGLENDIGDWIATWNQNPRPFTWTKTAGDPEFSRRLPRQGRPSHRPAKLTSGISGAGH
jgi:hypothetical protein